MIKIIGFQYVCNLFNVQYTDIANLLNISKQTINSWTSGRRPIPKKYLPKLSEMFNVPEEYFQKEMNEVDKLIIQKEKLKKELTPKITGYNQQLMIGDNADIVEKPVYNTKVMNEIELEIEKTRIIENFRELVSQVDDDFELYVFKQINLLLNKAGGENTIFQYTVDAVSHYYNVLPYWVGDPESDEFVEEFIELAKKYEGKKN